MARIPYADIADPAVRKLVADVRAQRGDVPHLYGMLMHAPEVAAGWLNYLTAIRQKCALPGGLREMVIMRIAILNGAPYEADQHRPIALRLGMTERQLDALGEWHLSNAFSDTQKAVLAYTDAMTKHVHVPDEVFAAVRALFDDTQLVELTATVAAYNMVSRFLEAMQIHSEDAFAGAAT